jgi:hypothetical protein
MERLPSEDQGATTVAPQREIGSYAKLALFANSQNLFNVSHSVY